MNCWIGSLRGVAANFHRRGRKPSIDEPAKKRMLNSTLEDSAGHVQRFHHAVGCHQIRENLIVLAVSIAVASAATRPSGTWSLDLENCAMLEQLLLGR